MIDQVHSHSKENIRRRLSRRNSGASLRDFVFGGIDGTVTTFAIVSGVAGAGLSHNIVLVLGLANLVADGFSMAAGNYSATRSDLEQLSHLTRVEHQHLENHATGEEAELRQILKNYRIPAEQLESAVSAVKSSPELWIDLMLQKEYGVSSIKPQPVWAAVATFIAFLLCGSVPLLPFLLNLDNAMSVAMFATALVFFAVGATKTRWTHKSWWVSGLETLGIGLIAAALAYYCGHFLSAFDGH